MSGTYTLMHGTVSWAAADAACQAAGLQLASVHSAAQNALLVTAAAGNRVWIGGTDAAREGAWVWSPSNTPLSYTNWYPGEPNSGNQGGEDCVMAYSSLHGGRWNDAPCTQKLKYVCQVPVISYAYLGRGHCHYGYLGGNWDNDLPSSYTGDAEIPEVCMAKCNADPRCKYVSMEGTQTCSRYSSAAGTCANRLATTRHYTWARSG